MHGVLGQQLATVRYLLRRAPLIFRTRWWHCPQVSILSRPRQRWHTRRWLHRSGLLLLRKCRRRRVPVSGDFTSDLARPLLVSRQERVQGVNVVVATLITRVEAELAAIPLLIFKVDDTGLGLSCKFKRVAVQGWMALSIQQRPCGSVYLS